MWICNRLRRFLKDTKNRFSRIAQSSISRIRLQANNLFKNIFIQILTIIYNFCNQFQAYVCHF